MAERILITCTKRQLRNLLGALDVKIQKMIADGWTVAQIEKEYNAMLSCQLKDWHKRKEYFNSL